MSDRARKHFDDVAGKYHETYSSWESLYRGMRDIVRPAVAGKDVLDIGNGGVFAYDVGQAASVTAVDISPAMLDTITDPAVRKVVADARDLLGIADESADAALFSFTIHHITGDTVAESVASLRRALASAARALRPGGTLFVAEPVVRSAAMWAVERACFPLVRWLLARRGVSAVLFYEQRLLSSAMAEALGTPVDTLRVTRLPLEGSTDPLGGTLPGLVRIPAWLHPARHVLIEGRKAEGPEGRVITR